MKNVLTIFLFITIVYAAEGQAGNAAVFPETIYTQDDITKRPHAIEEVSVTLDRPLRDAALTRSVIDSASIAESANVSFSELLTKHSTIFVKTYGLGSMATVSFRGTGASHTRVEWNGITINNPMLGQVDFSQIPVWFADRVELYHGGSSMASGSGALGGAVVINSAPKWDRKFYGSAAQSTGSYATYKTFVSAGGGTRNIHAGVKYLYETADNNFSFKNIAQEGSPWMRQKDAGYHKHGATADIYWNAGRGNLLSLNAWFNSGKRNHPPLMSASARSRRIETLENEDLRVALGWSKHWERVRTKLTGGFQLLNNDYLDNNISAANVVANTGSTARSFMGRYNIEVDVTGRTMLRAILNADYHRATMVDRKKAYPENTNRLDRFEAGLVLGVYHEFSTKVDAFGLLRGEIADGNTNPLMPSLGVEYRPLGSGELTLKLNGARNYHRPTLNDLYWKPGGNPDLKPERGYTGDFSVNYEKRRGRMVYSLSLAAYASWIDDWIIWEPAGNGGYWSPSNKKEVFSRGAETSVSVRYVCGRFSVALGGNYAYTRSTNERVYDKDDRSKGKQLIYIPKHKANVMLDAAYGGWYLWWVWSSVSERFTTSSNEKIGYNLPAYDVHDLTVGHKLTLFGVRLDLQAKANNMFGRVYRALPSRPMPRQNFSFMIKLSF